MNPYKAFIDQIEAGIASAGNLSVSGSVEPVESDSKVLLFSPHPDDECVTGLLPLRLMRECGKQIINVPVTFGSNPDRQAERASELTAACSFLGWHVYRRKNNFEPLDVDAVVQVLLSVHPDIVVMPHAKDWNSRHISTHFLVVKALEQMNDDFSCTVIETEFWGAMEDPNLMVEGDAQLVADLVAATSLHAGEVARNPYHLLLPAWMQDNVRRGSELVGGQGGAVPGYSFATLYRLRKWTAGAFHDVIDGGLNVPVGGDAFMEVL